MKTKIGILYSLANPKAWNHYKKCGRTTQLLNKRITNLQTSLLDNCNIVYTTNTLVDSFFYEFLLKKILKDYRVRTDREFFDVDEIEIKMIFDFFNELNLLFDNEEKLNNYIINNYPEYIKKNNLSLGKKKKGLYVDTRY